MNTQETVDHDRAIRIGRIRLLLSPEQSPETIAYLAVHEGEILSSYELATALVQCDRTTAMPDFLFDFIVDLYTEACEAGNHNAMNDLGVLYYDGHGCRQDYQKAVYYYDMAARQGNRQAQENLG